MKQDLVAFAAGMVFAVGLGVAGMTNPGKVVAFLDLFGDWDPSLMLVMVGAIGVNAAVYYGIVRRRRAPLLAERFLLPTRKDLDPRLLGGAALFGAGWGLGGVCPGPGLVSLAGLTGWAALFVGSMLVGMAVFERFDRRT